VTEHPTAANNGWGRLPDGGGGRVHGKGSVQAKAFAGATAAGARAGYVYLHSAVDDDSRLAYTEPSTTKTQSLQSDSYTALACGSPPRRSADDLIENNPTTIAGGIRLRTLSIIAPKREWNHNHAPPGHQSSRPRVPQPG
jgi:hypothetical protein